MKTQTITNKKGEIEFRRKLVKQQTSGENLLDSEFSSNDIENILLHRINKTKTDIESIKGEINVGSYLEIGAERGQRALVLENALQMRGIAFDISFDMLKSADYYKDLFNMNNIPLRICGDANVLPFASNSVPFIFCYETLHHFPDPIPIIKEIHRILSPGGIFYFNEEPFKRILHLNLYKGKREYSKQNLKRNKILKIFDFFFKELNCNEIDHGIIENHSIPLKTWKKVVSLFDYQQCELSSWRGIKSDLFNSNLNIKHLFNYLLGGSIKAICRKDGVLSEDNKIEYICPSCKEENLEILIKEIQGNYTCPKCGNNYKKNDNILFLFSKKTKENLYPELE